MERAMQSTDATAEVVAIPRSDRAARIAAVAFAVVLLAVEAVIVAESWRGLTGFAELIGIHGPAAWGVPVTLDGVALVAALVALRAELAGEASGVYRATLFIFTAASAAANYWHGAHAGGTQAALYLGGMSLSVAWVFSLALRQIRREDRRKAGRVTERLPRFSAAHWGRYPGLTWRAWSLAVRDGHGTARAALDAAMTGPPEPELPPDIPSNGVLAAMPKSQAIRIALAHNDDGVLAAQAWLAERGIDADRAYMHDVKRGVRGKGRRHKPVRAA
jgi:Protein of unknown function (DUF2637)